jgi:hypothetical protein
MTKHRIATADILIDDAGNELQHIVITRSAPDSDGEIYGRLLRSNTRVKFVSSGDLRPNPRFSGAPGQATAFKPSFWIKA